MKKIAALLLIALIVQGCGVKRHAVKSTDKQSSEVSQSSSIRATTSDNTKTVITEKTEDTVTMPPLNMAAESSGITVKAVKDGDTLTAIYDPVKNAIRAAFSSGGKKVPVRKETRTEIAADVKMNLSATSDSSASRHAITRQSEVKSKWYPSWWWIVAVAVAALVGTGYWKRSRVKEFINKFSIPP